MVAPRPDDGLSALYPASPAPLSKPERDALLLLMGELLEARCRERARNDHDQEHQTGIAAGLASLVDRALRT